MNLGSFKLIPDRVHYDEFWLEIRKRNLWLIKLRYGAFVMLTFLIIGINVLRIPYPDIYLNTLPLWLITGGIMIYNLVFHSLWKHLAIQRRWRDEAVHSPDVKFSSLHFALLQIVFDLISLLLFIYYTGGIESPIYALFLFHIIIGSLLLPGWVIYLMLTITLSITISGAILEQARIIPHHGIQGILDQSLYNNTEYMLIYFTIFALVLYTSVYLANTIAKDLYRRQRSLASAYRALEDSEKSKSRYVMSVVHDLKTPIAAVSTYLNMLLEGTFGKLLPEQVRPLDRSKSRLINAIEMINDILYISQLKLGTNGSKDEDIRFFDILDEIFIDLKDLISSKLIEYELSIEPNLDVKLHGDRKLIKLAFSNLLSNAQKYTPDGGKIKVQVTEEAHIIRMSVADTGIGIPSAEKDKIFDEFYRSTISKKKGIEGTGLGMSIALEVVKKYDGKISVESPSYLSTDENNPGTEFIIEFRK
jgi:signal transduction histidine kinase